METLSFPDPENHILSFPILYLKETVSTTI